MNDQDKQAYQSGKKKAIRMIVGVAVLLVAAYFGIDMTGMSESQSLPESQTAQRSTQSSTQSIGQGQSETTGGVAESQYDLMTLVKSQRSGEMVEFQARVVKLLADDNDGSRHQRFLLAVDFEHSPIKTVLVAHNIDLAPRVPVEEGSVIRIYGQYEWNDRGGVIHWTHHDPGGRHAEGWIELDGTRYE